MKKKRLTGVLLMIAALIVMTLPVTEADAEASASDFVIKGNKLIEYIGKENTVTIPDTVDAIGEGAFEDNLYVEKVVIPNSVKNIEAYAFWGCNNLSGIILGSGVHVIGEYAFAGCKGLQRIDLSSNVSAIGTQAFGDCVNLEEITIPPETVTIHESAFDGCGKLKIRCEEGTVAANFAEKFYEKQKELPEYEDIPNYGNEDKDTETTEQEPDNDENLPSSEQKPADENIAEQPKYEISSSKIVGNKAVIFWETANLKVIGGEVAEGLVSADSITKVTVIDKKIIADQAYYKKDFEEQVEIVPGIEEIGEFAFARSSIEELIIPDGVIRIDYAAFYHCDTLKEVQLPETLIKVEPKAFEHTLWVKNFMEENEPYLISGGVLVAYHGKESEIKVPEGVRVIASGVFSGHDELEKVTLPSTLEYIGEESFYGCSSLQDAELPDGLKKIEDRAFRGCVNLKEITIPPTVQEIGLFAFENADVTYLGEKPAFTYENTATRLSNSGYRGVETAEKQILDIQGNFLQNVSLDGAKGKYKLKIEDGELKLLENAWNRINGEDMPDSMRAYQLSLTDESEIPIIKLGRCSLEFVIPVEEEFIDREMKVVQIDRNGQMEDLSSQRVTLNGEDGLLVRTNFVSTIGLYCTEKEIIRDEVQVLKTDLSYQETENRKTKDWLLLKFFIGSILFVTGTYLVLTTKPFHKFNKQ